MEKNYDPKKIESPLYHFWEEGGFFEATTDPSKENYSIMIPPPNVTGTLHMGHAFQDTLMDALIRYHRMQGKNTLWQPGMDHAGIATQMVVERQLSAKGINRKEIGREAFVEAVWKWKEESGGSIAQQLRRMGASLDWSKECFTLDDGLSDAVKEVFIRLYEEGLIYRGKRLVNWDPVLQTAVSDLEVVNTESEGYMYYVRYPFVDDESDGIVIATTRPETILADGAIAVHPDDERFSALVGQFVWVPMVDRKIEIITDSHVDPSFGSGCVKITGAHDFNDFEMTQRHADKNIPLINLFTKSAHLNENAPKDYQGLDRFAARDKIIEDLNTNNYLIQRKKHKYVLPIGDRSQSIIEPFLTDQWFVDAKVLAKRAIEVVENGDIRFIPKNWENTYFDWMRNIQDWCISRQLWWGHQIPAWYGENGELFVACNAEQAQKKAIAAGYTGALVQDEDVMDTWFSSALWPFTTLGWPNKTVELEHFYPTSVLVTGFDIIFFWVARMIMCGVKFTDEMPFKEVYVHGLVRDALGQKMSKSKGNVLDPIDIIDGIDLESLVQKRTAGLMQPQKARQIEEDTRKLYANGIPPYGCDALRFTFAAMASTGRDIRFELSRCEGYRNFCNKLWNGARFVLMRVEDQSIDTAPSEHIFDRWIESRLQKTIAIVDTNFNNYRLDLVAAALYDFVWHDFCDWYLELSKVILKDENHAGKTRYHMIKMIDTICRLSHPIIPFLTEEIWQSVKKPLGNKGQTLMLQSYPKKEQFSIDEQAEEQLHWIKSIVNAVRNIRSQMNVPPSTQLTVFLQTQDDDEQQWLATHHSSLNALARLQEITISEEDIPKAASAICGNGKLYIPLQDVINTDDEKQRLEREIERCKKMLTQLTGKLNNEAFIAKAPSEIVDDVKQKKERQQSVLNHLENQYALLSDM